MPHSFYIIRVVSVHWLDFKLDQNASHTLSVDVKIIFQLFIHNFQ